jgi:hypothetical protein
VTVNVVNGRRIIIIVKIKMEYESEKRSRNAEKAHEFVPARTDIEWAGRGKRCLL